MYLVSCTNTHCDFTGLVNHGMVKNTKTWISWEWNIIFLRNKKILNLCSRWHILRSYSFVAEVTFNDIKSIASKFNEFFSSVAKETDMKIPKSTRSYTNYLKNRNLNSLLLNPATKSEIEKIINMFSDKKAVGRHNIQTNILNKYKKILSIPLALIINISFQTGIFLELCKIAHLIPVYKKGDQLDC